MESEPNEADAEYQNDYILLGQVASGLMLTILSRTEIPVKKPILERIHRRIYMRLFVLVIRGQLELQPILLKIAHRLLGFKLSELRGNLRDGRPSRDKRESIDSSLNDFQVEIGN